MVKSVIQFESSNYQALEKINVTSLQTITEIDDYILFTVKKITFLEHKEKCEAKKA